MTQNPLGLFWKTIALKVVLPTKRGKHTLSQFLDEKKPISFKEYRLDIIKDGYPAQQDNLDTSLSNVRAASFSPSAIVK